MLLVTRWWLRPQYLDKVFSGVDFLSLAQHRYKLLKTAVLAIGHFRVPPRLCFKTRVGAQSLIWKSFLILMQIKLIFTRKVVHLAWFWKWGFLELGSGRLLNVILWNKPRAGVGSSVGTTLPWVLINPYPSLCDATLPFSSIVHGN